MRIFVDTEFTSFSDPRLISIGAAAAAPSGEIRSFYGIVTDFPRRACTRFVIEEVLPRLALRPASAEGALALVARAFAEWIAELMGVDGTCEMVAGDEADLYLAGELLRTSGFTLSVGYTLAGNELVKAADRRFAADPALIRHNAYDDALCLMLCWR